ncbi:MAG: hypothetical protein RSD95_09740 [Clostridia bacterium]
MSASARMKWDGRLARAIVRAGGENGVRQAAQFLGAESQKQVPLDTGALLRSMAVDSSGLEATVSYDTPYAVRWHEQRADFQRGRKNKYLEDPANDPALAAHMLAFFEQNIRLE